MKFLKKIKTKHIALIIMIFIIFFIIRSVFFSSSPAPSYITAQVERGDIEQKVLADGTINAYKLVNVGVQVSGQIQKLYVQLGDEVKIGDMIAEIDDIKQKNDLKQSEASLASLKAQRKAKEAILKNNQLTYNRQLQLVKKGMGIQSELDAAEAQLDVVKADITSLEADIIRAEIAADTAKVNLGYTKIVSPINGIVVAIPIKQGQTVNSVQSAPTIVKVAQLDKMTVEAQISEADVIKVKTGMPVYFTVLGKGNERFDGLTLRAIEPAPSSLNSETSPSSTSTSSTSAIYYNGLFDVDNPDRVLRISMTAQVYIVLAESKNALYIPSMSIQKHLSNSKATVLVLDENQNETEKEIEVGIDNNVNIEVRSGLNEGETIIASRFDSSSVKNNTKLPRIKF